MSELITLSSGFIINNNGYYVPYTEHVEILDSILSMNKSNITLTNKEKLIEENVFVSKNANELYYSYMSNNSFDNYMNIIDFTYENLADIALYDWFKLQLVSGKLSNIVKKHILDFLKEVLNDKVIHSSKLFIPFNLRLGTKSLDNELDKYIEDLDKVFEKNQPFPIVANNWRSFIIQLDRKDMLLEFYKLVFVDFY